MDTFGERLKDLRVKKKMTLDLLAEKLGKQGRGVVSNWERGKSKPDADTLSELADVLETTTDYLLRGIEVRSPDLESILRENALQKATIEAQQETIKALKELRETKNIEVVPNKA